MLSFVDNEFSTLRLKIIVVELDEHESHVKVSNTVTTPHDRLAQGL